MFVKTWVNLIVKFVGPAAAPLTEKADIAPVTRKYNINTNGRVGDK